MLFFDRRKNKDRRSGISREIDVNNRYISEMSDRFELKAGIDRRHNKERRSITPRRKNARFKVKDAVFVEIKGLDSKAGQIIDVSKGGIAFRYIDIGNRPKKSFELGILVKNNGFHLENLPFKTMTDLEDNEFAFSSIKTRRRSGKFGDLSQSQTDQIEHFIVNYSVGITQ